MVTANTGDRQSGLTGDGSAAAFRDARHASISLGWA
jgi:hypothetical protein